LLFSLLPYGLISIVSFGSGDLDAGVPFMSTQAWIRNLNYSIVDDWRAWFVNGQVGG